MQTVKKSEIWGGGQLAKSMHLPAFHFMNALGCFPHYSLMTEKCSCKSLQCSKYNMGNIDRYNGRGEGQEAHFV